MLPKSKYLNAFSGVGSSNHELIGDFLIVEVIPDEELKTKSGLIISSTLAQKTHAGTIAQDKPTFVRVLLCGEGYYEEGEDGQRRDVPLETKPGDIVLIGAHAIKRFSMFGPIVSSNETGLGLARESEIQMRFPGEASFNAFFDSLSKGMTNGT